MSRQPEQPPRPLANEVWPPAPALPETNRPSFQATRRLLTNFPLLDSGLGLILGALSFWALVAAFSLVALLADPLLPETVRVDQFIAWSIWTGATLPVSALFVVFVRRYPYLMVGFAVTALGISVWQFFVIINAIITDATFNGMHVMLGVMFNGTRRYV